MKYLYYFATIIIIAVFTTNNMSAKSNFVNQIPNGAVFSCSNCHVNPGGGGSLNPFGHDVNNHRDGNNINWNETLAKLDSDGDGYTNGEELLDPNGTWKQGDINPGEENNVGNPGDPKSTPIITDVEELSQNSISIFPNPVTNYSVFSISLNKTENLLIDLINLNGTVVNQIYNGFAEKGEFSIQWLPFDKYGNKLNPAIYFLRIRFNHQLIIRRVLVL